MRKIDVTQERSLLQNQFGSVRFVYDAGETFNAYIPDLFLVGEIGEKHNDYLPEFAIGRGTTESEAVRDLFNLVTNPPAGKSLLYKNQRDTNRLFSFDKEKQEFVPGRAL